MQPDFDVTWASQAEPIREARQHVLIALVGEAAALRDSNAPFGLDDENLQMEAILMKRCEGWSATIDEIRPAQLDANTSPDELIGNPMLSEFHSGLCARYAEAAAGRILWWLAKGDAKDQRPIEKYIALLHQRARQTARHMPQGLRTTWLEQLHTHTMTIGDNR